MNGPGTRITLAGDIPVIRKHQSPLLSDVLFFRPSDPVSARLEVIEAPGAVAKAGESGSMH